MEIIERFMGCLTGLACGDAVGATVEFKARGQFQPLTDMLGGGKFRLKKGEWTDDTSMALCLAASLIEIPGFDARDQMDRYWRWANNGYMSCKKQGFGIGKTVIKSLCQYRKTGNPYSGPTNHKTAGNGSIMRLAPVPMFYFPNKESILWFSGESSRTTHGAEECIDACRLLGGILFAALSGKDKTSILFQQNIADDSTKRIKSIACLLYKSKVEEEIKSTGYVIDSLEAALWCFLHTESFEEAILKAVNLGDDADTTAAVCGQIAGAYYGITGVPGKWINSLYKNDLIIHLSKQLCKASLQARSREGNA